MEDLLTTCFSINFGAYFSPKFFLYLLLLTASSLYGLSFYKNLNKFGRLIVALLISVLGMECFGRVLIYSFGSNFIEYHFLVPLQLILYTFIYLEIVKNNRWAQVLLSGFLVLGFILMILNSSFFQKPQTFPTIHFMFLSFIVISCCLISFYFMLKNPVQQSLNKQPVFWFNAANIFFYSLTFLFFGYYQYMISIDSQIPSWSYYILWAANLLLYGTYWYVLYLIQSQKKIQ